MAKMGRRSRKFHFCCSLKVFLLQKENPQYRFLVLVGFAARNVVFSKVQSWWRAGMYFLLLPLPLTYHKVFYQSFALDFSNQKTSKMTFSPKPLWILSVNHNMEEWDIWASKMGGGKKPPWCDWKLHLFKCLSAGWQLTVWWEVHWIYGGWCASHIGVWRNLSVSC